MKKLSTLISRRHGWLPDVPDVRDRKVRCQGMAPLPSAVSLVMPPVYDQGNLGSCVANAVSAADEYLQADQRSIDRFLPSRLWLYRETRLREGTVLWDCGCQIRDCVKVLARQGVCTESEWPYIEKKFARQPPISTYVHARQHQALEYCRVDQTAEQFKGCLASGFPFVCGITLYESFMSAAVARSGIVPMPGTREKAIGGHAVLAIGYAGSKTFRMRNSWGASWGQQGYFDIPFDYLLNPDLCSDIWVIRKIE